MSIQAAVEVVVNPLSRTESIEYENAWRSIYEFVLGLCRKSTGCKECPDDTRCEHAPHDLAQEICVSLGSKLHAVRELKAAGTFVRRVCENHLLDRSKHQNRQKRAGSHLHVPYVECADDDAPIEISAMLQINREYSQRNYCVGLEFDLEELVKSGQLTELEMRIAIEHFVAGKSLSEVGTDLGMTKSAVHRKVEGTVAVLRRTL